MFSNRYVSLAAAMWVSACLATEVFAGAATTTAAAAPRFSGARAMALLREQCAVGPRLPGSAANAAVRGTIVTMAEQAGLRAVTLCFSAPLGESRARVDICNIVVSAGPAGGDRLWLGAHYDSRPWADQDPDPARRRQAVLGANDGASGTAVLMHLMELMGAMPPPGGVDLLFFDGEDSGRSGDAGGFCVGSRHLAATMGDFGSPLAEGKPRGLILLDMVGERNARIPQEGYSLEQSPDWTALVFSRAEQLGLTVFEATPGRFVYDDHMPFLAAGIPAVNLIDFDYPQWHTSQDTPEQCSPESLEQVGALVTDLVYRP